VPEEQDEAELCSETPNTTAGFTVFGGVDDLKGLTECSAQLRGLRVCSDKILGESVASACLEGHGELQKGSEILVDVCGMMAACCGGEGNVLRLATEAKVVGGRLCCVVTGATCGKAVRFACHATC